MKKHSLLILIMLTFCFSLFAQRGNQTAEVGVNDPAAHSIIKDCRKQLKSQQPLKIAFTYVLENKTENIKDSKKGEILVNGNKFKLDFMGQQMITDGKTTWTYMPDAKEVQVSETDPETIEEANPLAIIDKYEKEFRAKLIRKEGNIAIIDLIPLKGKTFHKIRLKIDQPNKALTLIEIHDKSGTTYSYQVNKMDKKVNVSNKDFTFDKAKYPGVEVIDLR